MKETTKLSESEEYQQFRSTVPLKSICVDNSRGKGWKVFDAGPKSVRCPLIFLPPVCGTADIYFRQLLELSTCGYRVLSVESPSCYWTVYDWCIGFKLLLDHLRLDRVHLFGSSLGGFLAQKFVEHTFQSPRIVSVFLCNTFVDTEIFDLTEMSSLFWILPTILLKQLLISSLRTKSYDNDIISAVAFVAEKANTLSRADLASRLTMGCSACRVRSEKIRGLQAVTIMDVFDEYALCSPVREEVYKIYPNAKLAQLKTGGNFPFLSKYEEVNIHLKIHLRKFESSIWSPLQKQSDPMES